MMALAERVKEWESRWLRKGIEQGLAAERDLLRRQASRKFGGTVGDEPAGRLARMSDPARLAAVGITSSTAPREANCSTGSGAPKPTPIDTGQPLSHRNSTLERISQFQSPKGTLGSWTVGVLNRSGRHVQAGQRRPGSHAENQLRRVRPQSIPAARVGVCAADPQRKLLFPGKAVNVGGA